MVPKMIIAKRGLQPSIISLIMNMKVSTKSVGRTKSRTVKRQVLPMPTARISQIIKMQRAIAVQIGLGTIATMLIKNGDTPRPRRKKS